MPVDQRTVRPYPLNGTAMRSEGLAASGVRPRRSRGGRPAAGPWCQAPPGRATRWRPFGQLEYLPVRRSWRSMPRTAGPNQRRAGAVDRQLDSLTRKVVGLAHNRWGTVPPWFTSASAQDEGHGLPCHMAFLGNWSAGTCRGCSFAVCADPLVMRLSTPRRTARAPADQAAARCAAD